MCGIAGVYDRTRREPASEEGLRGMLAMLRHRGPDEFGVLVDREAGLASARLSIIDIGGGSQPIANENRSLWIVFNGEVFNYLELRKELESLGHRFRTSTDTEVVLHLYERYGPGCLDRLNGQFAIAIWDTEKRRLFLGRDRLGVRPVFYTETSQGVLLFASEIKSILSDPRARAEIDPAVIRQIFTFWAPLAPHTAFRGIVELPAGHYLTADERAVRVERYWWNRFPEAGRAPARRPFEEVVEEFRELLTDACRVRLRADVPVGAYLSGGIDSSAIAALARRAGTRLSTFSIAFSDSRYDESAFQAEMAAHLGTEHRTIRATQEDIGRVFPAVVWHAEVPMMRTAPAPMFLLSKLVRESGFKVVLTGEGADEFLAGYDIFKEDKVRRFWARRPEAKWRALLLKRLYPDVGGLSQNHIETLAAFFGEGLDEVESPWFSHAVRWRNNLRTWRFLSDEPAGARSLTGPHFDHLAAALPGEFKTWGALARAQHLEISIFLSQYLLSSQGDRMGMAHSIEGRFPFLDVRVTEFCNRLEPRLKMRCLREKHLLKAAAKPWLPASIHDRLKRPYRAPVQRSFFHEGAPDYVRDLLAPRALADSGLFRAAAVGQLVKKIADGTPVGETDEMALAGILSAQLVHELFVKNFRRSAPLRSGDRVKVCRPHTRTHGGLP